MRGADTPSQQRRLESRVASLGRRFAGAGGFMPPNGSWSGLRRSTVTLSGHGCLLLPTVKIERDHTALGVVGVVVEPRHLEASERDAAFLQRQLVV